MEILVVLEHQALRRIAVQGVVGGTRLDQLVELAEEVQLGIGLDEVEPWLNCCVVELGVISPSVKTDCYAFDQIAELSEHVL